MHFTGISPSSCGYTLGLLLIQAIANLSLL
jgi:hypothetical protein